MKLAVLFFSGTGNTKWAIEYLCNSFSTAIGFECEKYDLSMNQTIDISEYDNILIAHPIYGANIPPIVVRALENIEFRHKTHVSILTTYGNVNALGPFKEKRELGIEIYSYFNLKMFNNISTPDLKSRILPVEDRKKRKDRIERRLDFIVNLLKMDKRRVEGIGLYLIPGILIKRIAGKRIRNNYKSLSIDSERCIRCQKCKNECPANAINLYEDSFLFNENCTACMRCYNNCPSAAIEINSRYADPGIYQRYQGPWV